MCHYWQSVIIQDVVIPEEICNRCSISAMSHKKAKDTSIVLKGYSSFFTKFSVSRTEKNHHYGCTGGVTRRTNKYDSGFDAEQIEGVLSIGEL